MNQGFVAVRKGDREEYNSIFRTEVKTTEWSFDRVKEAFEQVAQDEARKLSIVQKIMIRSTDYLRRIIAAAGDKDVTCPTCPTLYSFPLEDNIWWVSGSKG